MRLAPRQDRPVPERPFHVSPGVHVCDCRTSYILLDCNADRYYLFSGPQSAWFTEIRQAGDCTRLSDAAYRFARRLCEMNLVTWHPEDGHDALPQVRPPPSASLYDVPRPGAEPKFAWRTALAFLQALACATWLRRTASLNQTLACATRWKAHPAQDRSAETVRDLARRFDRLTPYVFTSHEACFFRSLVLLKFLSLMGVPADWEFGVRPLPFSAHCWIEYEGMVLNDHLDHASEYRKILSV